MLKIMYKLLTSLRNSTFLQVQELLELTLNQMIKLLFGTCDFTS